MEPSRYLAVLRRRAALVAGLGLMFLLLAAAVTLRMPRQYVATTTVLFSPATGRTAGELNQGSVYTQNLVKTFARVATEPVVLDTVIRDLGLDTTARQLATTLTVRTSPNTTLLELAATSPRPQEATDVVNALALQLGSSVRLFSPTGRGAAEAVNVSAVAPAQVPTRPLSNHLARNLVAGLVFGLGCGVALAVLLELLDRRVRGEDDVRRVSDAPVLGTVVQQRLPSLLDAGLQGPLAESYRRLRINLLSRAPAGAGRTVVVTSAVEREGKTTVAVNLAVVLAEVGVRVLLVDTDLRHPDIAAQLGMHGTPGLVEVLRGQTALEDAVQPWRDADLHVLSAGRPPTNPGELLGSTVMARLLDDARERYDVVLLDSPPLLPSTDATVLAQRTDGALVLVNSRRTSRDTLTRSLDLLDLASARVLGVALNEVPKRASSVSRRSRRRRRRSAPTSRALPRRPRVDTRTAAPGVRATAGATTDAAVSRDG